MKHVKQRIARDCFFCSVAMAAGMRYEELGDAVGWEVMSRVGDGGSQDDGSQEADWRKILRAGGFEVNVNIHRVWTAPGYVGSQIVRDLLWGRRAIIDILCQGDNHAVYWDGEKVHDPFGKGGHKKLTDIVFIQHVFLIKDGVDFTPEPIEDEPEEDERPRRGMRPRPLVTPVRLISSITS